MLSCVPSVNRGSPHFPSPEERYDWYDLDIIGWKLNIDQPHNLYIKVDTCLKRVNVTDVTAVHTRHPLTFFVPMWFWAYSSEEICIQQSHLSCVPGCRRPVMTYSRYLNPRSVESAAAVHPVFFNIFISLNAVDKIWLAAWGESRCDRRQREEKDLAERRGSG